jgi:hypothetical protein
MENLFFTGCIIILIQLFVPWSANSQGNRQVPGLALQEIEFDFGQVAEGSKITHDFVVLNQGDGYLEISKVEPGWGCSVASFDRSIPPGGEGKITLRVDTKGYEGNIHKGAAVYTNDPIKTRFTVGIKAFVQVSLSVKPGSIGLYGKKGATVTGIVEITAGLDKPLTIEPYQFSLEGKAVYRIEEIEKGKRFKVHFTNIPGAAESYSGYLRLKTNYEEKSIINLKIKGGVTK